jgi:hypothetical protein
VRQAAREEVDLIDSGLTASLPSILRTAQHHIDSSAQFPRCRQNGRGKLLTAACRLWDFGPSRTKATIGNVDVLPSL